MVVETADGETGSLHDVHHRACLDAALPKEGGGRRGDRLTRLLFLLRLLIHVTTSRRTASTAAGWGGGLMCECHASVGGVLRHMLVEHLRDEALGVRRDADDALGLL